MKHQLLRFARLTEDRIRRALRLTQSETSLADAAQAFWQRPIAANNSFWWHTRDSSPFVDAQDKWKRIGDRHVRLFSDFAKSAGITLPLNTVVEWGCGGGANAVAFGRECETFWGVDVSQDALIACAAEMAAQQPACAFHPLRVDVGHPEAALSAVSAGVDLFIAFYVFELFPSEAYGGRILKLAHNMLKPGGIAFIQIKYATDSWKTRSRRWAYSRGAGNMTTYRIEAFWTLAESCGFEPRTVTLVPKPPEVPDERYAYFMLQKPNLDSHVRERPNVF